VCVTLTRSFCDFEHGGWQDGKLAKRDACQERRCAFRDCHDAYRCDRAACSRTIRLADRGLSDDIAVDIVMARPGSVVPVPAVPVAPVVCPFPGAGATTKSLAA